MSATILTQEQISQVQKRLLELDQVDKVFQKPKIEISGVNRKERRKRMKQARRRGV